MKSQVILCFVLQLIFELSTCTHLRVVPGSTLELPCVSFQPFVFEGDITWKFNGEVISPNDVSTGSVKVVKNGLYLSIKPVTAANEGTYTCLVRDNNMEMTRTHNISVAGSTFFTIMVNEGTTCTLPCMLPPSRPVEANAVWFKETNDGKKTKLNLEEESNSDQNKLERLFPLDHDQSLVLRRTAAEDAGFYHCKSPEGTKLSTVNIIVRAAPPAPPHSCEGFTTPWEPCQDHNSRTGGPILQESMTEFSMKVYSHLRQIYPATNLLFSPISISGALTHLLLGARNETRRALETAVCVPHDFHCLHFQMKKLREEMSSSLQMASQIYYDPQMNLSQSFTEHSREFYDSEPSKLLESSEESARMINSWVANKTQNMITQLVDSISPNSKLILLNAVSFNGQWKMKFDEKPKTGHFTKLNGDLVKVPLLYHLMYEATVMHSRELRAQVARFALSGNSSLFILLPVSGTVSDLQQVEERMSDLSLRHMVEQMQATSPQQIEVTLPQIKLEAEPDMNILIKKLGLSSLFEGANLCGLYAEEMLVLDEAKHKAFLALTERGVEAGAVTSMSFSRTSRSFSALRPFIVVLWSDRANVPLFMGRVTDP